MSWGYGEPRVVYLPETRWSDYSGMVTFCKGYPGNQAVSHFASRKINAGTKKVNIKFAMDESMLAEGCRNPIIGYATNNASGPTLLLHFGGTRFRSAARLAEAGHDVCLPAIIYDAPGHYPDAQEVTEENYEQFFTDVPRHFRIDHTADYAPLDSHYAIRAKDYVEHDPAGIAWLGDDPHNVISELSKVRNEKHSGALTDDCNLDEVER